ncbi:hypothetical protein D3C87_1860020 [compost metagenome]
MGAMDTPVETILLGRSKNLVFLGVVKIVDLEPALLFPKWRLRQRAFSVSFEWAEIVLQTGDERDVAD